MLRKNLMAIAVATAISAITPPPLKRKPGRGQKVHLLT